MRKSLLIAVCVMVLVAVGAAATPNPQGPLRNFETLEGFDESYAGGHTDVVKISFENRVTRDLPVAVRVFVNSSEAMTGEEFGLEAEIRSENSEETKTTALECEKETDSTVLRFTCFNGEEREILAKSSGNNPSRNNVTLRLKSNIALFPGEYDFRAEVLSMIGIPSGQTVEEELEAGSEREIGVRRGSVTITAEEDTSVGVTPLDGVTVPGPGNGKRMLGGLDVDVERGNASGTVTISYSGRHEADIDEDSIGVYFFDESSQEWERVPIIERGDRFVKAKVSHFSIYAAFANLVEERERGGSGSDIDVDTGGGGTVGGTSEEGGEVEEGGEETGGPGLEEEGEQPPGEQPPREESEDSRDEGPGTERARERARGLFDGGITGFVTAAEPGVLAPLLALLAVGAALLFYARRGSFQD